MMRGPGSAVGAPMNPSSSNSFNQQQQSSSNSYVSTQPVPTRPNYYQSPGATSGGTSGYAASGVGSYIQTQEFSRGPVNSQGNRGFLGTSPNQMFDDGGSMIGPSASQIGQTPSILASKGINMNQNYGFQNQVQKNFNNPPMSMANPVINNFQNKFQGGGSTLSVPPMAPIEEVRNTKKSS